MRIINQLINQYTTPEQRKQLKKYGNKAINKVTTTVLKTLPPLAYDVYTHVATSGVALKSGDDKVIKKQIKDLATDAVIAGTSLIGLKGAGKAIKPVAKAINKARVAAVKANPKANELINKGIQTLKSKQKEVSDALDDIFGPTIKKYNLKPELKTKKLSELTEADWKQIEPGHQMATPEEIEKVLGKPSSNISVEEYLNKYKSKFSGDELKNLADFTKKYISTPKLLTTSKEETKIINKASKTGIGSLSEKEADTMIDMLRSNSKGLGDLAKEVGVKSKKELPDLMKFANQLGDIIKNSPNYIKSAATGKDQITGLIANGGLSIYDLYQAYKENDGSLLPKTLNNVARVGAGLFPGNPILKILYGGLGYKAGDTLTNAAFSKLGVKHETSDLINKEIQAGIYQPGLSAQVEEFLNGYSGRKYHVVGNKIFDYATGRPVNIRKALYDSAQYWQFKTQEVKDQKKALQQEEDDLKRVMQQGYPVDQSQFQQIQIQKETLNQQEQYAQKQIQLLQPLQFDPEGDLVEQYKQNVVAPEQQKQEIEIQQLNQDIGAAYNIIAQKVQADSEADLDRLITPQSMMNDFYQHQVQARMGRAYYFNNIDDYVAWRKSQELMKIQPQIRQQAASIMQNGIKSQQELRDFLLSVQKHEEDVRHNKTNENIEAFKANVDMAYKSGLLTIDQYKAITGRIEAGTGENNAVTNRMNAITNQGKLEVDKYNAETGRMGERTKEATEKRLQGQDPYVKANLMGQTVMNAGMSGLNMDQFLNANTSVFGQVFPGTQQGNQQNNQQSNSDVQNYLNSRDQFNNITQGNQQ